MSSSIGYTAQELVEAANLFYAYSAFLTGKSVELTVDGKEMTIEPKIPRRQTFNPPKNPVAPTQPKLDPLVELENRLEKMKDFISMRCELDRSEERRVGKECRYR